LKDWNGSWIESSNPKSQAQRSKISKVSPEFPKFPALKIFSLISSFYFPETPATEPNRYLSVDETLALIRSCEPHLRPMIVTAVYTGLR
jgi:hypothetical protein